MYVLQLKYHIYWSFLIKIRIKKFKGKMKKQEEKKGNLKKNKQYKISD